MNIKAANTEKLMYYPRNHALSRKGMIEKYARGTVLHGCTVTMKTTLPVLGAGRYQSNIRAIGQQPRKAKAVK